jgi:hypothetical protein
LEVGKLDLSISKILVPLLADNCIAISAMIIYTPPVISMFSAVDIELHVFVLPKLFLSQNQPSGCISEESESVSEANIRLQFFNLLQLIAGVSVGDVYKRSSYDTERAKFRLEALYESVEVEHRQLPEAESSSSLKCTLRPYQKQALYWLLCREKSIEEKNVRQKEILDPQWQQHQFPDSKSHFYSNRSTLSFSLEYPHARPKSCGGILGDEVKWR